MLWDLREYPVQEKTLFPVVCLQATLKARFAVLRMPADGKALAQQYTEVQIL
jgi:hypothetical protein